MASELHNAPCIAAGAAASHSCPGLHMLLTHLPHHALLPHDAPSSRPNRNQVAPLTLGAGGGATSGLLSGVQRTSARLLHASCQGLQGWVEELGRACWLGPAGRIALCAGCASRWQVRSLCYHFPSCTEAVHYSNAVHHTCVAPTAVPAAYAAPSPALRAVSPAAVAVRAAVSRAAAVAPRAVA